MAICLHWVELLFSGLLQFQEDFPAISPLATLVKDISYLQYGKQASVLIFSLLFLSSPSFRKNWTLAWTSELLCSFYLCCSQ